jgi:hypothetical protein
MVQCSDIQNDLPIYSDDVLDKGGNELVEEHLSRCPLCRQRLDEYKRVQAFLSSSSAVRIPEAVLGSIRSALAIEAGSAGMSPQFRLVDVKRDWMKVWLMPSSVGGIATVLLVFSLLWFVLNSVSPGFLVDHAAKPDSPPTVPYSTSRRLTPVEYASSRMDVAGESPSVNPGGSIVELTRLLDSEGINEDEVVVVADVYENGSAKIAEIVEAPHDRRAVTDIRRAFESELAYAPFVPASLDQRSDRVRVVFKIQSVNVEAR